MAQNGLSHVILPRVGVRRKEDVDVKYVTNKGDERQREDGTNFSSCFHPLSSPDSRFTRQMLEGESRPLPLPTGEAKTRAASRA